MKLKSELRYVYMICDLSLRLFVHSSSLPQKITQRCCRLFLRQTALLVKSPEPDNQSNFTLVSALNFNFLQPKKFNFLHCLR